VAMWGKVVEHARGARAQYAYPQRMRLVCGECIRRGRVPAEVTRAQIRSGSVVPVCDAHAIGPAQQPIGEIQSKLLDSYGVELLPAEGVADLKAGRLVRPMAAHRRRRGSKRRGDGFLGLCFWLVIIASAWHQCTSSSNYQASGYGADPISAPAAPNIAAPNVPLALTPKVKPPKFHLPKDLHLPPEGSRGNPKIVCGVDEGGTMWMQKCHLGKFDQPIADAVHAPPLGRGTDCRFGSYSYGADYWICWYSIDPLLPEWINTKGDPFAKGGVS
jgi:hypothetical protein